MAKRRANHEGTIFKRKNGTWRAQVSIHGRRLNFSANTQKECQEWLKETISQIDEGYSYSSAQTTLKRFLEDWLISIQTSRSPSTLEMYQATVKREINPRIGQIRLKDLHPEHIQGLYDLRLAQGASPHTIKRIHKVLHCALEQGVKLGLLVRNPASVTSPPKLKQKEMSFYTEGQVQQFLKATQVFGEALYPLYYLAIHTGMRKSELLGLRWSDIDWEHSKLKVQRQLRWKKGGEAEFPTPKSRNGIRTIILGQDAMQVLKDHLAIQGENCELIFIGKTGQPFKNHQLYRSFKQIVQKSKLPKIRFHDLRHTAASLMLNYGIPVIIVSKRLGHARASITIDVYGHLIPSKQEEAAILMDRLMNGKNEAGCTTFAPAD
jgi:integrase